MSKLEKDFLSFLKSLNMKNYTCNTNRIQFSIIMEKLVKLFICLFMDLILKNIETYVSSYFAKIKHIITHISVQTMNRYLISGIFCTPSFNK